MFVEERRQEILRLLQEAGKVRVKELSTRFQVTEDCIRKDLAVMEQEGLLKRAYGGAVLESERYFEHSRLVSVRKDQYLEEKQSIAKKAVALIPEESTIYLDNCTTNIELAKEIVRSKKKLNVVCGMLDIAMVLANCEQIQLILLGGKYQKTQHSFLGNLAVQHMDPFRFDCAFMGVVGIDVNKDEVTVCDPEDGLIKKAAVRRSREVYLLMETRKFEFDANYSYMKLSQASGIICEKEPKEEYQQQLKYKNIAVLY